MTTRSPVPNTRDDIDMDLGERYYRGERETEEEVYSRAH